MQVNIQCIYNERATKQNYKAQSNYMETSNIKCQAENMLIKTQRSHTPVSHTVQGLSGGKRETAHCAPRPSTQILRTLTISIPWVAQLPLPPPPPAPPLFILELIFMFIIYPSLDNKFHEYSI